MSNVLKYRGYFTRVEYDSEGGILHGKIEGIVDLVTFAADTASEVEERFHDVVDDYLEMCSEIGKNPNKPFMGSFNVRISPETHRKASMRAFAQGISLNAYVQQALEKAANEEYEVIRNASEKIDAAIRKINSVSETQIFCESSYAYVNTLKAAPARQMNIGGVYKQ